MHDLHWAGRGRQRNLDWAGISTKIQRCTTDPEDRRPIRMPRLMDVGIFTTFRVRAKPEAALLAGAAGAACRNRKGRTLGDILASWASDFLLPWVWSTGDPSEGMFRRFDDAVDAACGSGV
jgi:hypothetical protein